MPPLSVEVDQSNIMGMSKAPKKRGWNGCFEEPPFFSIKSVCCSPFLHGTFQMYWWMKSCLDPYKQHISHIEVMVRLYWNAMCSFRIQWKEQLWRTLINSHFICWIKDKMICPILKSQRLMSKLCSSKWGAHCRLPHLVLLKDVCNSAVDILGVLSISNRQMTWHWHWCDMLTSHQCQYDVMSTSCACWVMSIWVYVITVKNSNRNILLVIFPNLKFKRL